MTEINEGFGMGLIKAPIYNEVFYGDIGLLGGYYTALLFNLESASIISFTINGLNMDVNDFTLGFTSILSNKPYAIPAFDVILDKSQLTDLQGKYTCINSQNEIKIDIKYGKFGLTGQIAGQSAFSLFPVTNSKFSYPPLGVTIEFPQKNVLTLVQGGGTYKFIKSAHD
jgi:D-alanyl-D-alanine carboxypeptidase